MARRWRQPVVIWLRSVRKNQYWKRRQRWQKGAPVRVPWTSASLYGVTLALAGLVLWKVPARPTTLPVSTRPIAVSRSWMDKTMADFRAPQSSLRAWLNDAIPLIGLALNPHNFAINVRAMVMTGITEVSGVHLNSLDSLLKMEIPALSLVTAPKSPSKPAVPSSHPPVRSTAQNAVDKSLPGDGGHVWAELGQNPVVGLYQTHSHESFWPFVASGSSAAYSTNWSKTIVQVGWWLAQDLHQQGLSVIQSRVDNMSEGVLASYNKSYYTAKELLKWYPTVRLLVDLHRASSDVAPVTVHGVETARIVIVVGTNKLLPNAYWHQNLAVALKLAHALNQVAPGILEGNGIDMVPYRYNQQLMPGDLMIEVGGPSSTLAEERYAVNDLAAAIRQIFHQGAIPPAQSR